MNGFIHLFNSKGECIGALWKDRLYNLKGEFIACYASEQEVFVTLAGFYFGEIREMKLSPHIDTRFPSCLDTGPIRVLESPRPIDEMTLPYGYKDLNIN